MKAVIQTQGRQFTVQAGDIFKVNRYPHTEAGSVLTIKDVLMYEDESGVYFGTPVVDNAIVCLQVLENKRDKKLTILKRKRRKGYQRKRGHRQSLSVVKVQSIEIK
ncbi:MAG: 50S ribosomal protein L21 [Puniceicoccales bacterium]|jgi:large subunit ribosomal protein L21|nr:50S ribosomal protein L21 [Puniceicoccales bacterium]